MRLTSRVGLLAVTLSGCINAGPSYDLKVKLINESSDERTLNRNIASYQEFPCDLSFRPGQCADNKPFQVLVMPADVSSAGALNCAVPAHTLLKAHAGETLPLGRSDGGVLWVLAIHGGDDDSSGIVDPGEQLGRAELFSGTIRIDSFEGEITGELDAFSDDGSYVRGTIGAVASESGRGGSGPRCEWPYGAQAD